MPSIPLVTELGSRADQFQALLNNTKGHPSAVLQKLSPSIAADDLFSSADSRVIVRARPVIPFDKQPMSDATVVQKTEGYRDALFLAPKISVSGACSVETTRVPLDGVFVGHQDTTQVVYDNACSTLLSMSVSGASTCILCYGQTGSGKTFTTSGLVSCLAKEIPSIAASHIITVAAVEIQSLFNIDLVGGDKVQVVEDPSGEVQLLGCKDYTVETEEHLLRAFDFASSTRTTKSTGRNETSSRSHMVLRLTLTPRNASWAKPGRLFMADLAGSENTSDSATHDKVRQQEAKFINSSLMTLKDCVRARAMAGTSTQHLHIPYRQSPLTLLLRDCFELAVKRPTKTVVIACVSPLLRDVRHTSNTLRYASLLTVTPPPIVVEPSADDPNGWPREKALSFLTAASNGRLTNPELVLGEGDGRAMVQIPQNEFIQRVLTTHAKIGEKAAEMIYTEVWKAVIDARTKSRQRFAAVSAKGGSAAKFRDGKENAAQREAARRSKLEQAWAGMPE
jgi:hypothetical protein